MATPAFGQDDEPILIYPRLIPPDENGVRVITVSQSQEILLGANWGACSEGLAQLWAKTANVAYVIDGQPIFTSLKESRKYWSSPPIPVLSPGPTSCLNKSDTGWWVYWKYDLGTLSPGDHPAQFDYWNDPPKIDGGDYDGDGKPDKFGSWHIDFIIRVVE